MILLWLNRLFAFFSIVGSSLLFAQPYVTVDLSGRLGNQCFQVAACAAHAWEHGAVPLFPDFKSKEYDNIPINYEKVFWRLDTSAPKQGAIPYREPHYHYAPVPFVGNMRLYGFFQSEKYFKKYKERIIALLSPSWEIVDYLSVKYSNILRHPNSVSIHFRSYKVYDPEHKIYSLNDERYIKEAMAIFPKDALFVVFSDDIPWCKEHLKGCEEKMVFVENETSYHDFYLMSLCKHNIISNSSFSWWAAYLNQNKAKVVVAPKRWLEKESGLDSRDVIPDDWITIP